MNLMVTGGAGFIGSNFVRYWLEHNPDDVVVNFDALTYAGCKESLNDVETKAGDRYRFEHANITDNAAIRRVLKKYAIDTIVNFAAESHNSRAILNPAVFVETNVLGTQALLDEARNCAVSRFHHISTCEVFGDLSLDSDEKFTEQSPYKPNTPYNASKAAADMICRAYYHTFQLPITISNCANNYGPYQFPEKLIPNFTIKALSGEQMPLYQSSKNKREWIHVLDHCRGIEAVIKKGSIGSTYNIGTEYEADIETIADTILEILHLDSSSKKYVPDRPAHDRRYLLDSSKIAKELGWRPEIDFHEGIRETVEWYKQNESWWRPLLKRLSVNEESWSK